MCHYSYSCTLLIYLFSINFFGLVLRYIAFQDYFECFACKELEDSKHEYDYIVVGSGSAGSIIARRLIEDKNTKVLLMEAGSHGNSLLDIPALGPMLQTSIFDWQHRTVPQKKACLGLKDKMSFWPMGKIVGGTSMLHNMVYVRGHPEDFKKWYKDKSDFDYNTDILPYFKKLENFETDDLKSSVIINDLPFSSNLSQYLLKAAKCSGYAINDGVDSESGFSFPKATIFNGNRWTSWHRLAKMRKKSNLTVRTNSFVERVLFRENFEAYGVRFSHLNDHFTAKASKGVILAAGVIGTPKILMLSGIGPKKHLKKVRINPIIDLPVGNNLQDHVTTGLDLILVDSPPDIGIQQMMSPFSALKYFVMSKGPWTTIGCEALVFFNLDNQNTPDLQFMVLPIGVSIDNGIYLKSLTGISDKSWETYFRKINKRAFTILPVVLHPRSRGTVRLKNKNPTTPPLIDPNYLSDDYDVDIVIRGIEEIKKLLETKAMQDIGATLYNRTFPGCETFEFDTRPYWECYIRHLTITSYHPVGTCKLGEVVNYDFQVIGTSHLYVVDGSILPELPSGNPNAAIMMMAEKAADVIKSHHWLTEQKSNAEEVLVGKKSC